MRSSGQLPFFLGLSPLALCTVTHKDRHLTLEQWCRVK